VKNEFNSIKFFLEDLFDDFPISGANNLKCDIYEKEGNYIVEADVPGFKKEDINIEYEDGYLTLAAEKSEEKEDENKNYLRKERYSTSFKRQFYLGNIKEDQIKASFNDGTLKVIAPKQEEVSNKKQISIE